MHQGSRVVLVLLTSLVSSCCCGGGRATPEQAAAFWKEWGPCGMRYAVCIKSSRLSQRQPWLGNSVAATGHIAALCQIRRVLSVDVLGVSSKHGSMFVLSNAQVERGNSHSMHLNALSGGKRLGGRGASLWSGFEAKAYWIDIVQHTQRQAEEAVRVYAVAEPRSRRHTVHQLGALEQTDGPCRWQLSPEFKMLGRDLRAAFAHQGFVVGSTRLPSVTALGSLCCSRRLGSGIAAFRPVPTSAALPIYTRAAPHPRGGVTGLPMAPPL